MTNVLTIEQEDAFKAGLALLNLSTTKKWSLDDLRQEGAHLVTKIVTTHEPLSNFVGVHGSPSESRKTPDGHTIHVWDDVKFLNKKGSYLLYVMVFDGITASMIHRC